jgi:hypothetical protein
VRIGVRDGALVFDKVATGDAAAKDQPAEASV